MKYFVLLAVVLLLGGCAMTTYRESMLPDGKTWEMVIDDARGCSKVIGQNKTECKKKLLSMFSKRATELCGAKPKRLFTCPEISGGSGELFRCRAECQ